MRFRGELSPRNRDAFRSPGTSSVVNKTFIAATAACFALLACGGSGPSGGPRNPAPGVTSQETGNEGIQSGNAHYSNVIEMLRGKAPGLEIIESNPGQIEVRVRGLYQSFQGTNQEPLVIIDGAASGRPAGQALLSLTPDDVDRIQVLKDVGSTSVYGTRGANGVILVTLKKRGGLRP